MYEETVYIHHRSPGPAENEDTEFDHEDSLMDRHISNWCCIFVVALLICGAGIGGLCAAKLLSGGYPEQFVVMINAGPSGVQQTLFRWNDDHRTGSTMMIAEPKTVANCYSNETLAGRVSDPNDAGSVLSDCLESLALQMPSDRLAFTHTYMGVTGDMRLLNATDPLRTYMELVSVKDEIGTSKFMHSTPTLMSGQQQAACDLLTANWIAWHNKNASIDFDEIQFGFLGVGDFKTEIGFLVNSKHSEIANQIVHINENVSSVFGTAIDCFGFNMAWRKYLAASIQKYDQSASAVPLDCFTSAAVDTVLAEDIFVYPCLAVNHSIPMNHSYSFEGTGNFGACYSSLAQLLMPRVEEDCPAAYCQWPYLAVQSAFDGTVFLASEELISLVDLFDPTGKARRSLDSLETSVIDACQSGKMMTQQSSSVPCFRALYSLTVLRAGFGFDDSTWQTMDFTSLKNESVTWTMGYWLNVSSSIPMASPVQLISRTLLICLSLLLVLSLVTALGLGVMTGLFWMWNQRRHNRQLKKL